MRKFFLTVLIIIFLNKIASPEEFKEINEIAANLELRDVGVYYTQNEILRYKVYWEFLYAADAEMGLILDEIQGKKIYFVFTKTTSNKSFDLIYKVRNQTVSYIDYKGFYSLKFFSYQDEAGKVIKENVIFDYNNNLWRDLINNTTGYISDFLQDVVSALWWLRLQDIEVGRQYRIEVYSGKVIYPMVVDVLKIQKVEVFDKVYECFKIEPKVDLKRFPLFRAKGRLFVYLTNDKKKLPVKLESRVLIGRVFADLIENSN
ncbi:MAG: DUF3108 domain-containing protein [Endomicrobia bacterium]|nr:DUF3108 domain-containing protein [Endomicrobiia bacterium]